MLDILDLLIRLAVFAGLVAGGVWIAVKVLEAMGVM